MYYLCPGPCATGALLSDAHAETRSTTSRAGRCQVERVRTTARTPSSFHIRLQSRLTTPGNWFSQIVKRGIRSGLCTPETRTLSDPAESIDDTLFERIMHNPYHVIHHLLPPRRELSYNIRQRHHDRQ